MHGDASLATRSCLCGRLFVNDFEKISAKISRVSADTDTRKKREYRPIISAGRYIGRSLVRI